MVTYLNGPVVIFKGDYFIDFNHSIRCTFCRTDFKKEWLNEEGIIYYYYLNGNKKHLCINCFDRVIIMANIIGPKKLVSIL